MSIIDDRGYNQGFKPSPALTIRNQQRVAHLLRRIDLTKGTHHMLEIGCGTGEYASLLASQSHISVLGTDICQPFVEYAQQQFASANLRFACFDFTNATEVQSHIGDMRFDSVVGNGILHHMFYHLDDVLRHIRRLLVPGGRIAFMEPNLYNPYIAAIFQIGMLRTLAKLEPSEMAFSRTYITHALHRAGFVDICVEYRDFLVPGTPVGLIGTIQAVGAVLERIPGIQTMAQSLLISAQNPAQIED